jgi:N6-L-threonylcarbamoyladenine synthase
LSNASPAASVVTDEGEARIRSNLVLSQIERHRAFGGIVPELAARAHLEAVDSIVAQAMRDAGVAFTELDGVAVAAGPGLIGGVMVGTMTAKAIALVHELPLAAVNHLEGHALTARLTDDVPFPYLLLLVSGGHTELILMRGHGQYEHLGRTLDDAAGEAFDKGARLLGLGYPGGPAIQRAAEGGDPDRFALPRAWLRESDDFSFSGLKTALLREVEPYRLPAEAPPPSAGPFPEHRPPVYAEGMPVSDLAAAYQAAIVEVLAVKTARAARRSGARTVLLAGGVAANRALRERLTEAVEAEAPGVPVRYPPLALCPDNAAMVAGAAYYALRRGAQAGWEVDIHPQLPLEMAVGSRQ